MANEPKSGVKPKIIIILLITLITALALSLISKSITPQIDSIPVLRIDSNVIIDGQDFGSTPGQILVSSPTGSTNPIENLSWSPTHIEFTNNGFSEGTSFQVIRPVLFWNLSSELVPVVIAAGDLPTQPFDYQVPTQKDSPWPSFRRDQVNNGRSPLPAKYAGDKPWMFQTGKGIFSTPIIDKNGIIYFGSADHLFYAINPDGTEKWRFTTGEIIDSAALLPREDDMNGKDSVIVPSGDGYLYKLSTADGVTNPQDRVLWKFDARVSPRASYNNWWEGNVAVGYDNTFYAGNTNFNYYAITPDGGLKWTYPTSANNWSIAAIAPDGTIYWGSNDTFIRAVDPSGKEKWRTRTLGFIAASAALGSDGTVYIGSFDSYLYALDPLTGNVKWKFKTNDHIYTSAAVGVDVSGITNAIYIGSTDGRMYALDPQGKLLWQYDTGDPIRSSPVLGADPQGNSAKKSILYFGAGNGHLYALNVADGTRRWSFDTTPADPVNHDRNDLNGSPALGYSGIYIGGEHGQLWYMPYDYCLNHKDEHCSTAPGEDLPKDTAGLYYVTPGGSVEPQTPEVLPVAGLITQKLLVRKNGVTVNAHVCNNPIGCPKDALQVKVTPAFDYTLEKSADGQYLYILPKGFLQPDTQYSIDIDGKYYTGGLSIGNLKLGGSADGSFNSVLAFHTPPVSLDRIPLEKTQDRVTALEWTRLAVPIPPMMPSLNQIGFDYMDWIMGTVEVSPPDANREGNFIMWVVGGKKDQNNQLVVDPQTQFVFPLSGIYNGGNYIMINRKVSIPVTGIPIPFNYLDMRGELLADTSAKPGTTLYADTDVLSIPTFGPLLVVAGLANDIYKKLIVSATYLIHPYEGQGPANLRPKGVTVDSLSFNPPKKGQDGKVQAHIRLDPGTSYPLSEHRPGILLVDMDREEAVYLDYVKTLSNTADAQGNLQAITLTIPEDVKLPEHVKAYIMLDVFPVHEETLTP